MGIRDWLGGRAPRPDSADAEYTRIQTLRGEHYLSFCCGELPADAGILAAAHEPNGYFWEGVATYLAPEVVARLDLDSEAGLFSAQGSLDDLRELRAELDPFVRDATAIRTLIAEAEAQGHSFDD